MQHAKQSRIFYGWIVVAGAFLSFAVSSGLMHAYTVFFVAFLEEFGWSRADTSVAYALSQLVSGISAPFIGIGVDRFGTRRLVLVGGIVLTLGLAVSSSVSVLWQINLLYGVVMTLGANCLGLVVFVPLVSRWFPQRRGRAIAVVQAASGVGRALATPLVQALVVTLGWRRSYLVLAVCMAGLLVPLAWLFRLREPEGSGLPTGDVVETGTRSSPAPAAARPREWRVADAIRTMHLWLLFAVYMFTGLGSYFVSLHQLAFAVDVGFDKLYAATVLGVGSLLTIGGIIGFGTLSDYIGREITAILAYGFSILGVVWAMSISSRADIGLFWLHACCFGVAWGARGPLITAKTADLFQGRNLGAIVGVITIGTGIGSAIGSWVSGKIFDLSGSYQLAFMLSIGSYLGGCVTFWVLRRPLQRSAQDVRRPG